ncbi:sensor histidine kinase [Pseudoalteromonas sp. MMG022]|uniref:sensor histidine kinase n=1 Tax=Pseudoalteromonas sp. MMG022 TaxID=2909978 RepID=UPI001F3529FD|nr:sensor histidine kinase [Pseudoalteromonas sp. MMG022]MCF6434279.1 ATP-binding protein [Pseudoalteromonas sp. MMG022]
MIAFSPNSAIGRLLLLRTIAIVVQLLMVLLGTFFYSKNIDILPALSVIALESLFQLASVYAYRKTHEAAHLGMLLQLLADIVFLTMLLSLSGGASNAFVSLLLLPIMIAAVILPRYYVLITAFSAIVSYCYLFFTLPDQHLNHMDMHQHFLGMLVNFVFSVFAVVLVVMVLAKQLQIREKKLAQVRETQLKNEQMMALGAAAAQATHQLATPIATLHLLFEEVQESNPDLLVWDDIALALEQCKAQLNSFRTQADYLKSTKVENVIPIEDILQELNTLIVLQYPEQQLVINNNHHDAVVLFDPMLIPALLNIIANAARANDQAGDDKITIHSSVKSQKWYLNIIDNGAGIEPQQLLKLGHEMVQSDHGLGMALLLSNATLERLHGHMTIENNQHRGTTTRVVLPLAKGSKNT